MTVNCSIEESADSETVLGLEYMLQQCFFSSGWSAYPFNYDFSRGGLQGCRFALWLTFRSCDTSIHGPNISCCRSIFNLLTQLHPVVICTLSNHLLGLIPGLPKLVQLFITLVLIVIILNSPLLFNNRNKNLLWLCLKPVRWLDFLLTKSSKCTTVPCGLQRLHTLPIWIWLIYGIFYFLKGLWTLTQAHDAACLQYSDEAFPWPMKRTSFLDRVWLCNRQATDQYHSQHYDMNEQSWQNWGLIDEKAQDQADASACWMDVGVGGMVHIWGVGLKRMSPPFFPNSLLWVC